MPLPFPFTQREAEQSIYIGTVLTPLPHMYVCMYIYVYALAVCSLAEVWPAVYLYLPIYLYLSIFTSVSLPLYPYLSIFTRADNAAKKGQGEGLPPPICWVGH